MIEEDYVSFEVAKLLKEKGFDGDCQYCYIDEDDSDTEQLEEPTGYDAEIDAPTLQMAMKWIRKKHNIEIIIDVCKVGEEHKTMYAWTPVVVTENYLEYPISQTDGSVFGGLCDEHEEAVEKGILYCLNKLI